jgi:hypothetical protein
MQFILRKFPIQENVEWQKFLSEQSDEVQSQPFPEFMKWLEKAGVSWEKLVAAGMGARREGKTGAGAYFGSHYHGFQDQEAWKCFMCVDSGHIKRDCPRQNSNSRFTGGGERERGDKRGTEGFRGPRAPPRHKKYLCAFHKDQDGRFCFSDSCQALKRLGHVERVRLLTENKNCKKCCHDCPQTSCTARTTRIC